MHKIKDKLMDTLYEFEDKIAKTPNATLNMQDIEKIHKIADTVNKIESLEEDGGYSEDGHYMGEGRIYGTSYDSDTSYARGRRHAKRDSMGRYSRDGYFEDGNSYDGGSSYRDGRGNRGYSRDGYSMDDGKEDMIENLENMMHTADPKSKEAIKRCIKQIENA